ncbi:MAG: hypothetical protein K0M58_09410 [Thiobacillus sp.]|nr:hypothetical protein [Thiobacillus sp.]
MSGPWEAYQEQKQSGPWEAYAKQEQDAPALKPAMPKMSEADRAKQLRQTDANVLGGLIRGAGSIGSTILYPWDRIKGGGREEGLRLNRERRASIDSGLQELIGSNPESAGYKTGKISSEIAGTAGVGNVLAKGVLALPMLSKAPAAGKFANALKSGGFSTGAPAATRFAGRAADMGIRSAGGGITGGAMTGLIDPGSAGTGAMIGAALPPSLKVAAKARQLVKRGAGAATSNILGASTGTGAESVRAAYAAGKTGSTKFLDNMRGKASFDDVVGEAKGALQNMRADRAAAYRSGMVDIKNDASVIDFKPIQQAVSDIRAMGSFKGQQINRNAASTVDDIVQTVDNWASLNPKEYHTPEGLDALKQAIGDIRDSTQFGTAARRAADTAYNSVKNEIVAKAPTYSKVMKDYSEASALLKEIESGLSLGSKGNASKDAAVRKLQSLLRNNAQTNYGNRLNLARQLEEKGGADLMPALAGQSMSSAMPRGLSGGIQKAGALGIGVTSPASIPALLAAAPFTSPRLVGEGLYGLGRLTSGPANLLSAGKQGANRLAVQHPGLLDLENALYRSLPVMATLLGQPSGLLDHDPE